MSSGFAAPAMRDAFLAALDAGDTAATLRLAEYITGCTNPLPAVTCEALALPLGSTYANAARHVLLTAGAGRSERETA